MPATTESKALPQMSTPTEKPLHYQYLKEFRCEQCPLFLQHKCTNHKPFTCFYWHFMNQRRRRPIRKRDGTFNYSPDVYCTKYDETTGLCSDGDDCPYLHRTAGDTERRYHLRYYKTGICVYDTDSRGFCVKNGPHCAFAHGLHDLRNPVYDIRELQAMEGGNGDGDGNGLGSGPNSLDKERNALNEDPRWQDTAYVLANYKTEICKRPPRLCRQGYACPQFHNNKDRRRSPKKYKYRSTPCPNVKQGDEWGDPSNCDASDQCPYCHTRTEQQFHPEIYKSTKCNDIQQTGYCPRGAFCAFAHVEKEISIARELSMEPSTDLSQIVSNVLPPSTQTPTNSNSSPVSIGSTPNRNPQTTTTAGRNQSVASSLPDHFAVYPDLSAPQPPPTLIGREYSSGTSGSGSQGPGPIARPRSFSTSQTSVAERNLAQQETSSLFSQYLNESKNILGFKELNGPIGSTGSGVNSGGGNKKNSLFGTPSPLFSSWLAQDSVESVLSGLDDLNLDDISMEATMEKEFGPAPPSHHHNVNSNLNLNSNCDNDNSVINSVLNRQIGPTQPVNIPGRIPGNDARNIGNLSSPPIGASPSLTSSLASGQSGPFGVSPFTHRLGSVSGQSIYDVVSGSTGGSLSLSPPQHQQQHNTSSINNASIVASIIEVQRLREEVQRSRDEAAMHKATLANFEEKMTQAMKAWKHEFDEANNRSKMVESQRDEALARILSLQKELESIKSLTNSNSESNSTINKTAARITASQPIDIPSSLSSFTQETGTTSGTGTTVSGIGSSLSQSSISLSSSFQSMTSTTNQVNQSTTSRQLGDISHLSPTQLARLQSQLIGDIETAEQVFNYY